MQPARTRPAPDRSRFSPEKVFFVAAAVILVLGSQMPLASYLSPKNGLGYILGIVGGVMLLLQSLYAVRKRMPSLSFLGSVPAWFQWHILLGVIAPVVILIHCGFSLGATNSNIALFSMLLVAGSGIFGRYFYSKIHRGLNGRRSTLADLQRSAHETRERGSKLPLMPELVERLDAEEARLLKVSTWGGLGAVAAPFIIATCHASSERLLHRYARAAIQATATRHKAVASQKERFERVAFDYISRRLRATREVAEFRVYERLFSVWHVLHVPLFLILIAAGIVHVVAVHLY
ncbi:MAG TPA: hypothetical protein VI653_18300 [Steroidobacteraceae bacterium]